MLTTVVSIDCFDTLLGTTTVFTANVLMRPLDTMSTVANIGLTGEVVITVSDIADDDKVSVTLTVTMFKTLVAAMIAGVSITLTVPPEVIVVTIAGLLSIAMFIEKISMLSIVHNTFNGILV